LALEGEKTQLDLGLVGNATNLYSEEKIVYIALEALDGSFTTEPLQAITIKETAAPLPAVRLDPTTVPYIKQFNFTETYPQTQDQPLDILLDVNTFLEIIFGRIIKGPNMHCPKVIQTHLGNILTGAYDVAQAMGEIQGTTKKKEEKHATNALSFQQVVCAAQLTELMKAEKPLRHTQIHPTKAAMKDL